MCEREKERGWRGYLILNFLLVNKVIRNTLLKHGFFKIRLKTM